MKRITKTNFTSDTLYPRVAKATHALLTEQKQVSPAGVFMKMGMLSEADFQAWRAGQVPYLEKVIHGSLGKVICVLRILAHHAKQRGLVPVLGHYMGPGRPGRPPALLEERRAAARRGVSTPFRPAGTVAPARA